MPDLEYSAKLTNNTKSSYILHVNISSTTKIANSIILYIDNYLVTKSNKAFIFTNNYFKQNMNEVLAFHTVKNKAIFPIIGNSIINKR